MTDVVDEELTDGLIPGLFGLAPTLHYGRWPIHLEDWSYRLLHDPTFAVQMRVCKEYRIPHSEFLSWSDLDQDKAVAFLIHEGQRCQSCGIHPGEWDRDENPPPFEAAADTCPGCEELARFNRHLQDQAKNAPSLMDGVKPHLRRTTGA